MSTTHIDNSNHNSNNRSDTESFEMLNKQLIENGLNEIRHHIAELSATHHITRPIQLIAVSKLKPVSMIKYAYTLGQRDYGENYVQELISKINDPVFSNCNDIRWHFIGHLQSNKCNQLIKQSHHKLYCVHSCDSIKLLDSLNKACINAQYSHKLRVLIQVNTSNETNKSGCEPKECIELYQHCVTHCSALQASGLMTIGAADDNNQRKYFNELVQCKKRIIDELGSVVNADEFELSMGMSGDYTTAIECESTMIRIGSTIFGKRDYPAATTESVDQNQAETLEQ